MRNELRYIDLGSVSKEIYTAIWEYDNIIDLKDPILIKFSTDKTLVSFSQGLYTDLTDYFYSPELLDIDKLRYYQKVVIPYDAEVCYCVESPDVTNFIYFYPNGGRINEISSISDLFMDSAKEIVVETCSHVPHGQSTLLQKDRTGSKSDYRSWPQRRGGSETKGLSVFFSNNDMFLKSDKKFKKCAGTLYRPAANNWGYCGMSITYKFDSGIANRVRTFDSKVKVKKFEVDDISDMIGGIWEVNATIDKDKMDLEVVTRMCKKLGMSMRNDSLTDEEKSNLFFRGHRRLTEKEWYLYGNNDGFEIRY